MEYFLSQTFLLALVMFLSAFSYGMICLVGKWTVIAVNKIELKTYYRLVLLGIILLFLLNYPLYLLIDVFQASASSHIEPYTGDLMVFCLIGLLVYFLKVLIQKYRDIMRDKILLIFYSQVFAMLVFWIIRYQEISCCSGG